MARFDVYETPGEGAYLLDCQADLLSHFKTRFVVPLIPAPRSAAATRLHPIFHVDGRDMVMVTQLASAVTASELSRKVTSLAEEHSAIINAIDMLVSGY